MTPAPRKIFPRTKTYLAKVGITPLLYISANKETLFVLGRMPRIKKKSWTWNIKKKKKAFTLFTLKLLPYVFAYTLTNIF